MTVAWHQFAHGAMPSVQKLHVAQSEFVQCDSSCRKLHQSAQIILDATTTESKWCIRPTRNLSRRPPQNCAKKRSLGCLGRARGSNKFSSVPLELCGSAAALRRPVRRAHTVRVTPLLSFIVCCVTLCHTQKQEMRAQQQSTLSLCRHSRRTHRMPSRTPSTHPPSP